MDLVTLAIAKKYTNDAIAEASTGEVDLSAYAKTTYVDEKVAGLVDTAPGTLDTLNELAAALGDDPNFATTIANQIGGKADKSSLGTLATKSTVTKSDLASAVQTSLGKADTALQSFTETDPTVPAWAKTEIKPTYTASEVGAVPTTRTVNNKALSADITITATDIGAVPTARTINGKTLSNNITLNASDVGALPDTTILFSGSYNDLTDVPTDVIINSSTEGSTKRFRITVDDTGTLTAVEVTE